MNQHDLEAEQAVLGAIISQSDCVIRVVPIIEKPEVFYLDRHQKIYTAVLELWNERHKIDIITVMNRLRRFGPLEDIGGAYYLTELTGKVASSANVENHARLTVEHWMYRKLFIFATELLRISKEKHEDVFEVIAQAQATMNKVLSAANVTNEVTFHKAALATYAEMEKNAMTEEETLGISSGFTSFDSKTSGLGRGRLYIIAARPAMGKTTFGFNIAMQVAMQGYPVLVQSLEMTTNDIMQRALSTLTGIYYQRIRRAKDIQDEEWSKLSSAIDKSRQYNLVLDDTGRISETQFRANVLRWADNIRRKNERPGLVLIDYLQLMHVSTRNGTRDQDIGQITRMLREVAKEADVAVIAISQLSREVEKRNDKRPMLSDLRESGNIEQDADAVMFLYRPEYYGVTTDENGESTLGVTELICAKNRHDPIFTLKFHFDGEHSRFIDTSVYAMPIEQASKNTFKMTMKPRSPLAEENENYNGKAPF